MSRFPQLLSAATEHISRVAERFHPLSRGGRKAQVMFSITCEGGANGQLNAAPSDEARSPPPMRIRESERCVQWNWIAIFSYTASLAVSLAIWTGLFRAVAHLVK